MLERCTRQTRLLVRLFLSPVSEQHRSSFAFDASRRSDEVVMQSFAINMLPFYPVLSLAELRSVEPVLSLTFHDVESLSPPIYVAKTLTKLAVCSIASLYRKVPQAIRASLLNALHRRLRGIESLEVTSKSSLGNVQTMLLLGMSAELHAGSIYAGGSRNWLMVGSAIRMAYDLVSVTIIISHQTAPYLTPQGLHRDVHSPNSVPYAINRRRRIWAAVVTADRWSSISNGQPMSIHLSDCDAQAPSPYDDSCIELSHPPRKPYALHCEITKVSHIAGLADTGS